MINIVASIASKVVITLLLDIQVAIHHNYYYYYYCFSVQQSVAIVIVN